MTSSLHEPDGARVVFGVPAVLTAGEVTEMRDALCRLWELAYQQQVGDLDADLEACRSFFDPVARGHKLRERLTALPPERRALAIYRDWARYRLSQVIALQAGHGTEVLQATSVGLVLALLVNRSTTPGRAINRLPNEQIDRRVDEALYAGAIAFADAITPGRQRSPREQRLRGGFPLTEARRRLADRLVITKAKRGQTSKVYIPEDRQDEVVEFIVRDLARRRDRPEAAILASAFDKLVKAFRTWSAQLASHGMIFEQPADTARLRDQLLKAFMAACAETPQLQLAMSD